MMCMSKYAFIVFHPTGLNIPEIQFNAPPAQLLFSLLVGGYSFADEST